MTGTPIYRRILLKVSGEGLMSPEKTIDPKILEKIAFEIKEVVRMGVQVCLVVGGGNIFRGLAGASAGMNRATGDYMGMLATVINALALQESLEKQGVETRVQSAIPMDAVAERFIRRKALRHLEKGRVVIFAAGTGNPYFTTDTCAALRAIEMNCDVFFKSTQVDGIYDDNPKENPNAKRYEKVSYATVLKKGLKVMDLTAVAMAKEGKLPVLVFNQAKKGALKEAVCGGGVKTLMSEEGE